MSKVKIQTIATEETEHEYPIYCYWQDEDSICNRYAKITEDFWTEIHFDMLCTKYKDEPHSVEYPIPTWMLNNICTEEEWLEALQDLKNYIDANT